MFLQSHAPGSFDTPAAHQRRQSAAQRGIHRESEFAELTDSIDSDGFILLRLPQVIERYKRPVHRLSINILICKSANGHRDQPRDCFSFKRSILNPEARRNHDHCESAAWSGRKQPDSAGKACESEQLATAVESKSDDSRETDAGLQPSQKRLRIVLRDSFPVLSGRLSRGHAELHCAANGSIEVLLSELNESVSVTNWF